MSGGCQVIVSNGCVKALVQGLCQGIELRKTEFAGATGLNLKCCNYLIMCWLLCDDNFQLLRQLCKNMPAGACRLNS